MHIISLNTRFWCLKKIIICIYNTVYTTTGLAYKARTLDPRSIGLGQSLGSATWWTDVGLHCLCFFSLMPVREFKEHLANSIPSPRFTLQTHANASIIASSHLCPEYFLSPEIPWVTESWIQKASGIYILPLWFTACILIFLSFSFFFGEMKCFCQASVCSSVLVSSQQWFGATDIKALDASQLSDLEQTVS